MYLENMLIQFTSNICFGEVTSLLQEIIKIKILRTWRYVLFFSNHNSIRNSARFHMKISQQLSKQKMGNKCLKKVFFRKNIWGYDRS